MMDYLRFLLNREEGQGLVEYALMLSLVAVVAAVALTDIGTTVVNVFNGIVTDLGGTPSA